MAALFIGEWVSTKTRAMVPSIFVTALIFIIGFWTIFPKNIVKQATFGLNSASVCVPLLLVHLGTTMNIRELIEQWKADCFTRCLWDDFTLSDDWDVTF